MAEHPHLFIKQSPEIIDYTSPKGGERTKVRTAYGSASQMMYYIFFEIYDEKLFSNRY